MTAKWEKLLAAVIAVGCGLGLLGVAGVRHTPMQAGIQPAIVKPLATPITTASTAASTEVRVAKNNPASASEVSANLLQYEVARPLARTQVSLLQAKESRPTVELPDVLPRALSWAGLEWEGTASALVAVGWTYNDWSRFLQHWVDRPLTRTEGLAFFRPDATFEAINLMLRPRDPGFSMGLKYRWSF